MLWSPPGPNPRAAADLLVAEAVGGTIELADVETLGQRAAGAAGNNNSITLLQGVGRHADLGELPTIVHLEAPLLGGAAGSSDVQRDERMRIDELKLRDDAFDGHLLAGIVNTRDGMMPVDRHNGDHKAERQ